MLAIPKGVYRAEWMPAIYTHETVLERLRNDTKAEPQKATIDP